MKSHAWRTVANSAPHLIPHLTADRSLLDVGCGPGTITIDLARRVAPAPVVGFDVSAAVIERAEALLAAPEAPENCRFRVDDLYAISSDDDAWAIVHAHQVLQHLTDPIGALRELYRVLEPGGILAVRDADYGAMTWSPENRQLGRWMDIYRRLAAEQGSRPDAGRHLRGWVMEAGFVEVEVDVDVWTFATPEDRAWWGDLWADRVEHSSYAVHAIDHGFATRSALREIAEGWRRWADDRAGFFACPNTQVIARKPFT